jgi:hypothetical protein
VAAILVKLQPSASLGVAERRANLRSLFSDDAAGRLGLAAEARWFVADLPDGADTPWDLAHARVADQLGISESDVVFAEPDIVHDIYPDPTGQEPDGPFAVAPNCQRPEKQNDTGGVAIGPGDEAWHLDDAFSQLASARAAVPFTEPRTRIAHFDTGYSRRHIVRPAHILAQLERSFVEEGGGGASAEDPDRNVFLIDNSGHGTGTLSVLAGGPVAAWSDKVLGGAPDADILPLRLADRVVLLKTSAFATALRHAVTHHCDVMTMSMGGLPSKLWREMVDLAYESGMCLVSAAGNNFNGLPTRKIVYPARYGRVIAVCGVMADGRPYVHLKGSKTMEGNYGPESKMKHAMAAYTPNIPWAMFGCDDAVRLNGGGTSSATPQVAAAAALWIEKNKHELPRDWRRVEAVRHALFTTAHKGNNDKERKEIAEKLGQGILRASDALAVPPTLNLPKTKSDNDSWALLRVLTGLGIAEMPAREQMFNLELQQRWLVNPRLQELIPDPDSADRLDDETLKHVFEAVLDDPEASSALRRHVAARYPVVAGRPPERTKANEAVVLEKHAACEEPPALTNPTYRRLRAYAGDPSLSATFDTAGTNEVTLEVRWESLEPGPVGEYVAVDATDATGKSYDSVDLNDPRLLARDGWAPSVGNAQFHQQMVYAVVMKTIEQFERALGRPVLWRPRPNPQGPNNDDGFVRRLVVRPHALQQPNAYYSPEKVALEFGYFEATPDTVEVQVPGSRVYTCLSHDIVVHETTHAVLDGMHRRYNEPTNPDVLAFHEAFADIVALMQHFTMRDVLRDQIARTRGDLGDQSRLGSLAVEFGHAVGRRGALRDAIGRVEDGRWVRNEPDPNELRGVHSPHSRGAVLVAAVFDAFLAIYRRRTADLLRIHTGGTGELPKGAIHPDLAARLAGEAAKSAQHVLGICIRALDYLPPVDVTFFEYLRALITADYDLVPDDPYNYRVAFVEAFRRRGIYPTNLAEPSRDTPRTLSVETLRWQTIEQSELSKRVYAQVTEQYEAVVQDLRRYADACTYFESREELFHETKSARRKLQRRLKRAFADLPAFAKELGISPQTGFEVHELRRAIRWSPDGPVIPQMIIQLTQSLQVKAKDDVPAHEFHGGSTLVVDLSEPLSSAVRYRVVKNVESSERRARTAEFYRGMAADPLRSLVYGWGGREPFAALHALAD